MLAAAKAFQPNNPMAFTGRVDAFPTAFSLSGVPVAVTVQFPAGTTGNASLGLYGVGDTTFTNPVGGLSIQALDAYGKATFTFNPNVQTPGTYKFHATGTSVAATSGSILVGAIGDFIGHLRSVLLAFEDIERRELGEASTDFATLRYGYGNWTSDSPVLLEKNASEYTPGAGVYTDFANGWLVLDTVLTAGDDIRALYKFALFSNAEFSSYLARSLSMLNGYKPQTSYTLDSAPAAWMDLLILGAYVHALESLSLKLPTFKYRRLWEDPNSLLATITARLGEARTDFKEGLAKIKRRGIVQPLMISALRGGGLTYQADNINWRNYLVQG